MFLRTFNAETLNSFYSELEIKDTECAIKSKLIDLLTQLKGFKFARILFSVFKKIENEDKTKYDNFYSNSKAKIIINLYYNYNKHTKIFSKRFRLDY